MTIKLIRYGTKGELVVEGRLDTATSGEAEEIFMQTAERFDTVVLNLEQMDYISSAGLRILKRLHITMKKKGGEMILTHVNRMVMEVFEMTGFAGLFSFE